MKNFLWIAVLAITISSCKQTENKQEITETQTTTIPQKEYPESIASVFKAHGGIDIWNRMNNLSFTIEKESGDELQKVDLKSRKVAIQTSKYTLGFDGEKVWLDQDSTYFAPQRARFYHNLYFYFYAMPFVLGDDGITYSDTAPLTFDGVTYPGTKISFGSGVGDAPDDEYILYRDPATNQMAWLAYTVTYGKNEKSDRFSYIKYDQWTTVNGVQLPSKLQWYTVEEGIPTTVRSEQVFSKPTLSEIQFPSSTFEKPATGEFAE